MSLSRRRACHRVCHQDGDARSSPNSFRHGHGPAASCPTCPPCRSLLQHIRRKGRHVYLQRRQAAHPLSPHHLLRANTDRPLRHGPARDDQRPSRALHEPRVRRREQARRVRTGRLAEEAALDVGAHAHAHQQRDYRHDRRLRDTRIPRRRRVPCGARGGPEGQDGGHVWREAEHETRLLAPRVCAHPGTHQGGGAGSDEDPAELYRQAAVGTVRRKNKEMEATRAVQGQGSLRWDRACPHKGN